MRSLTFNFSGEYFFSLSKEMVYGMFPDFLLLLCCRSQHTCGQSWAVLGKHQSTDAKLWNAFSRTDVGECSCLPGWISSRSRLAPHLAAKATEGVANRTGVRLNVVSCASLQDAVIAQFAFHERKKTLFLCFRTKF